MPWSSRRCRLGRSRIPAQGRVPRAAQSRVRTVASGESAVRPAVTERVLRGLEKEATQFESADLPDALTPREREVLRLIAAGFSNREIAEASGTAEGTVKNQASSILSKLGFATGRARC